MAEVLVSLGLLGPLSPSADNRYMNQFKVIVGRHIESLGAREKRTYEQGEIVHSEKNLCALFAHKFQAMGPVPEVAPPPAVVPEPVAVSASKPSLPEQDKVSVRAEVGALEDEGVSDPPTKPAKKRKAQKRDDDDWDE